MENMYGLNFDVKSFAVANEFVLQTNKVCYKLGQQLQPFCFFADERQKEYGVIDFTTFDGLCGSGKSFVDEVVDFRRDLFKTFGIMADTSDVLKKKLLLYDYLMSISICYVEIPKYVTKDGQATATFDKFLCTKNPAIMGAWMGMDAKEMQAKYSSKITSRQTEFDRNEIRYVKLATAAKGNSISVPRNASCTDKMTCIPLYMLYAFQEGFKGILSENMVKFTFSKDNGTVRELVTTLNEDIIRRYYTDNLFVSTMLSGIDVNTVKQGGMNLSSKIHRGYIKVPEIGTSIYDSSGCRSLNLARVVKAEIVTEVDVSYINVDLNSVVANFSDCLDYMAKHIPEAMQACYSALTEEFADTDQPAVLTQKMMEFVQARSTWLSTTFHRSLHTFMVQNPQWFPLYTGTPNKAVTSSSNYGVEEMDF